MTITLHAPMTRGETFKIRVEDGPVVIEGTPEPCALRQGECATFAICVHELVDDEGRTVEVARWERIET